MLVFLAPAVAAADTPQAAIKNSDHACVSGIDGDVCSHAFGDSDITVSLATGGKDCGPMKALLLQMSTRLEAPIEGAVTPATFDGCKAQEVTVHLPKVNAQTEFHVSFAPDNSKAPEVVVPVEAYPRDLLDPLKDWVKDERDALVVQDKDGKFKDFLDRNKIEFSTGASAKARNVTIVVADPDDMKDDKPEGNVMYLAEKVKDVPMVTVERTQQGASATANMKLVDGLSADDPLAERAFMKIFNAISK
jgi:hypothetical protein